MSFSLDSPSDSSLWIVENGLDDTDPVLKSSRSIENNVKKLLEELLQTVNNRIARQARTNRRLVEKENPPGWVQLDRRITDFKIGRDLYEQLAFRETLMICVFDEETDSNPRPCGGLHLNIAPARGNPFKKQNSRNLFGRNKFLVHLSSELDVNGRNAGSRITSWVDRRLQTLEEKRREFISEGESVHEQTLYLSTQQSYYYLRHNKTTQGLYDPKNARDLICEGANFILMRYLAITRYIGTFECTTTYINGDLCRNIYVLFILHYEYTRILEECEGPSSGIINDQKMDVCKIYRTIIEKCGIIHKSMTLLTLRGQILKQDWSNCRYVLQLNPFADIDNYKPGGNLKVLTEKNWKDDMELMSRYLDYKMTTKKHIETYLKENEEITNLISDYIQCILQLQPENVLDFTGHYFLSYTPYLIPKSEYFQRSQNLPRDNDDDDGDTWKYL